MNFYTSSEEKNLSLVIQSIWFSDCSKPPSAFQFLFRNGFPHLFTHHSAHKEVAHKLHILINGSLVQVGQAHLPNLLASSTSLYQNNTHLNILLTLFKLETSLWWQSAGTHLPVSFNIPPLCMQDGHIKLCVFGKFFQSWSKNLRKTQDH